MDLINWKAWTLKANKTVQEATLVQFLENFLENKMSMYFNEDEFSGPEQSLESSEETVSNDCDNSFKFVPREASVINCWLSIDDNLCKRSWTASTQEAKTIFWNEFRITGVWNVK